MCFITVLAELWGALPSIPPGLWLSPVALLSSDHSQQELGSPNFRLGSSWCCGTHKIGGFFSGILVEFWVSCAICSHCDLRAPGCEWLSSPWPLCPGSGSELAKLKVLLSPSHEDKVWELAPSQVSSWAVSCPRLCARGAALLR